MLAKVLEANKQLAKLLSEQTDDNIRLRVRLNDLYLMLEMSLSVLSFTPDDIVPPDHPVFGDLRRALHKADEFKTDFRTSWK